MSQNLVIQDGKISLPQDIIGRYRLDDETPVRMIETTNGILLVPLTGESMSSALADEIGEWQELGAESFAIERECYN